MRFNAERGEYGPGDIDSIVRHRVELARLREPHEFRRVRPNGRILEIRGVPLGEGGFVTTYTDVTERQHYEDQLLAERDRLKTLINGMPGGVTLFDAEMRLIAYNENFVEMLEFGDLLARNPTPTLEEFARFNAERGEYGPGDVEERVRMLVYDTQCRCIYIVRRSVNSGFSARRIQANYQN